METLSIREIASALGCECPLCEEPVRSIVTDSREAREGSLFVAVKGENFNGHSFINAAFEKGAAYAVASEHGAYSHPGRVLYVDDTKRAHIAIGGLYRERFHLVVVGITGSVGKTTTKEFVWTVLSAKYKTHKNEGNQNNEIGLPKTLFRLGREHEVAVIEMGMSGPGEIHDLAVVVKPDIGVITSIGVAHIEQLGSRENILRAKLELLDGMKEGSPLILCGDNDLLSQIDDDRYPIYFYGITNESCDVRAKDIAVRDTRTSFTISSPWGEYDATIPALGQHNILNALAAFTVGCILKVEPETAAKALADYSPAGMRQNMVRYKGAAIMEDCYNSNPDSLRAATVTLSAYPCEGRRIMVLSDMLELGELAEKAHLEGGAFVARSGIDMLLAYGPLSACYIEGANRAGMERCLYYPTKEALSEAVKAAIRPGDVVWFKASRGMRLEDVLETLYEG